MNFVWNTEWSASNAPKLKRGGQEGKRTAAGASVTPAAEFCDRKMPGPLSLAAHG
ncbi:MAG: hypothetical protein M3P51_02770 [Chloroflexota bacterium]|nr:hypothetical protein [Chloroflexota bacterium]